MLMAFIFLFFACEFLGLTSLQEAVFQLFFFCHVAVIFLMYIVLMSLFTFFYVTLV